MKDTEMKITICPRCNSRKWNILKFDETQDWQLCKCETCKMLFTYNLRLEETVPSQNNLTDKV